MPVPVPLPPPPAPPPPPSALPSASSTHTAPARRRLPPERHGVTHKFNVNGHEGYITVGCFKDGTPGELFITAAKEGSTVSGLMDVIATLMSMALQHGVPLATMIDKFKAARFEPAGRTLNPAIPEATSIIDYTVRWLELRFGAVGATAAAR